MATHKYNYYKALEELMGYACEAAKYLDFVVNNFESSQSQVYIEEIHKIEHAADDKHHEITNTLFKEFLPPIEREDIIELAIKIDDITDDLDDIVQHLYLYNVDKLLPECIDFTKLILECCESVYSIAKEFSNFRKSATIRDSIIKTHHLETEGDKIYAEWMRKVFTSDMSEKEMIVWVRLIARFEDCCDNCEHAAALFQKAVMKNS